MKFNIDPDIRKAWTLPSGFYTDPQYFEISRDAVFARSWQFVGFSSEFDDLTPFELLPGFLSEELLLANDGESLRCLSNVCTHRGKILVEQSCGSQLIRCRYHGRRFSLDGAFLSMPEFEAAEDFPAESDNLARIELTEFEKFVLVSLDPAAQFADFIGDARTRLRGIDYASLKHVSSRSYEINAHWALYCENYLEGFHIPFVHHSLNEEVDYGSYTTDTYRYSSLQTAFSSQHISNSDLPDAEMMPEAFSNGEAAYYLFIFPNLMFNFYPWGISVNVVKPITPSRTVVDFLTYVSDETKLGIGAGADLHRVEMEDEAVVESVQRGIASRFYSRGRYSPAREQGTHHFHRLIAEFMG